MVVRNGISVAMLKYCNNDTSLCAAVPCARLPPPTPRLPATLVSFDSDLRQAPKPPRQPWRTDRRPSNLTHFDASKE